MESEKNLETNYAEDTDAYPQLGEREDNAVRVAIVGIMKWYHEGEKPPPMRVAISTENPFSFRLFAEVLHEDGIDVTGSLKEIEEGVLEFQPKLYDDEMEESIMTNVIVIPEGLEKYFK